ncbi:MAG: DUF4041 domain-containing protein [Peptococcaceae bacterium]|nr:DUF4041 domain-containing protein [Peptococcaceae bacterium]
MKTKFLIALSVVMALFGLIIMTQSTVFGAIITAIGVVGVYCTVSLGKAVNSETAAGKQTLAELEALKSEVDRLKPLEDPERAKALFTDQEIGTLQRQKEDLTSKLETMREEAGNLRKEIAIYDNDIQMIEFGLYEPVFEFASSEMYKTRLETIFIRQKEMVKNDKAATFPDNFTLNGSASQGKKMVKDNVKQIIRSFNNECDVLIDKVKFNNIDAYRKRIIKSYEQLNKLNEKMDVAITPEYLETKLDELTLSYEYAVKKQEEKERAKEERERLREEAKLQKEIEAQRKALEKEQQQYQRALNAIEIQLKANPEDPDLLAKKAELEANLDEVHKGIEDVDYREANKRAGYVYIISNIGSFGENVYKIGMTRRLEPMDRVNELGDASVPFNFDVHAMIFSDDAPALENALHHAFEDKRVNMINNRREFFRVSLDEIEKVVKENFKERVVEFTRIPEAEQYRESEKMRQNA